MHNKHRSMLVLNMVLLVGMLTGCAKDYRLRAQTPPSFFGPQAGFCQQAQYLVSGTRVLAGNIVHSDYDRFVSSKPGINPLTTQQLVRYLDEARQQPRMISCKLKTADNLIAEYGRTAAGTQGQCGDVHRQMVAELAAITPASDARAVVVDDDLVVGLDSAPGAALGPAWLAPHTLAYTGADGALHIRAKAFRVDWREQRFADARAEVRGIHYCHLIAPDYLRRLVAGELQPPPLG
jgi:hypothetical protein